MTIQIEGLNAKQRMFADIMWQMNTEDEVKAFIRSLPEADRKQAKTVCEMMILALFDDVDHVDETTIEIINRAKETK